MPEDLFSVAGRVVVVTGGLGLLGRPLTRAFVDRGARVAVIDTSTSAEADDAATLVLQADVTRRASLQAALDRIEQRWGPPHALLNGAALDSPPDAPASENGPFEEYPETSWDRVIDVNLKGVFLACQIFGGAMARAGRGSIVNVSSIYGVVSPDQRMYEYRRRRGETYYKPVAYAASKSALLNLTRYLATYWAPRGVRVNTVTFGGVRNRQPTEFMAEYCRRVPLGRMAEPHDYDGTVIFLVSDASAYMTGSNLVVDGGFTAW